MATESLSEEVTFKLECGMGGCQACEERHSRQREVTCIDSGVGRRVEHRELCEGMVEGRGEFQRLPGQSG